MTETQALPLVSAIIATHNRKDLLKRAIDSVVAAGRYPGGSLIVGTPARIVKSDINWSTQRI